MAYKVGYLVGSISNNSINRTLAKNAIDWASRPWAQNSLSHKPSATIGASPGSIGTAVAQQHLESILSFCNSPRDYMEEFREFIVRVLTVLPRQS